MLRGYLGYKSSYDTRQPCGESCEEMISLEERIMASEGHRKAFLNARSTTTLTPPGEDVRPPMFLPEKPVGIDLKANLAASSLATHPVDWRLEGHRTVAETSAPACSQLADERRLGIITLSGASVRADGVRR